jgi:hypothetical protein
MGLWPMIILIIIIKWVQYVVPGKNFGDKRRTLHIKYYYV